MTDEHDNDSDRLIHPETWPCDPATLGPVFHGWDTSPGMIELLVGGFQPLHFVLQIRL